MRSIAWKGDRVVTQPWGYTTVAAEPLWNGLPFHCGIDIAFDLGEAIYAARSGTVMAVGQGFMAMQVGTEMHWYLHCSSYVVSRGQAVARGSLIGYAGSVAPPGGASFGVHLHFERQSTLALFCNIPATSLDPVPVLTAGMLTPATRRFTLMATTSELVLMGQGEPDGLVYKRFDLKTGAWSNWQSLGGQLLQFVSDAKGDHVDVFIVGTDHGIYHKWSDDAGASWFPAAGFESLGGKVQPGTFQIVGHGGVPDVDPQAILDAINKLPLADLAAAAAAIKDLQAHPSVVSDPALTALVQDIESRLQNLTLKVSA